MENLVVCCVNSLRADAFGGSEEPGYLKEPGLLRKLDTPSLDLIRDRGVVLPNLYTPSTLSSPALASLLTGLYPREHGLVHPLCPLNDSVETLAQRFRQSGFHTLFTNGVASHGWNGLGRGFQERIQGPLYRVADRIRQLNRRGERVFAVVETLDVRWPYLLSRHPSREDYHDAAVQVANRLAEDLEVSRSFDRSQVQTPSDRPDNPRGLDPDQPVWAFLNYIKEEYVEGGRFHEGIKLLAELYVLGVSRFDHYQLAPLLEFLEEREAGRRTALILVSPQGDAVRPGPSGHLTFGPGGKPTDERTRVPGVLFNVPDRAQNAGRWPLTSLVDLAPTLLDLFGLEKPGDSNSGHSLLRPPPESRRVFLETWDRPATREAGDVSSPKRVYLQWQGVLQSGGTRYLRRGVPVTDSDFETSLETFLHRVVGKLLHTAPAPETIDSFRRTLQDVDTREGRERFVSYLRRETECNEFELARWDGDTGDQGSRSDSSEEDARERARCLDAILRDRFPDRAGPVPEGVREVPDRPEDPRARS